MVPDRARRGLERATRHRIVLFVALLLWGVWAIRTAYVGWAEDNLSGRQLVGVMIRFVALYLVLTFLFLS